MHRAQGNCLSVVFGHVHSINRNRKRLGDQRSLKLSLWVGVCVRGWGAGFHSSGEEAVFHSACVVVDVPLALSRGKRKLSRTICPIWGQKKV